jgi:exodeoxyribonuclease-3
MLGALEVKRMTTVISWNVNGIRAAIRNGFMEWFQACSPDILCLQETRVHPNEVSPDLREPLGYKTFWRPAKKKGYSGVAVFSKQEPKSVQPMGLDEFDIEGRVIAVEYPKFTVVNAYFPNSQPERARIDYKLAFCEAMTKFCDSLRSEGRNVVLCGDYNIAHTEIDLARPKENEDNPGYLPEEREAMTKFLAAGYVDSFRHFTKEGGHYSWWSYRGGARSRNVGWRIDYHCVNKEFISKVKSATILSDVTGSDHCPVAIEIA